MNNRLTQLIEAVSKRADAFLIVSPTNRRYVTGFNSSDGFCVVNGDKITFITDSRYFEMCEIAKRNGKIDADIHIELQQSGVFKQIKERLSGAQNVLFEDAYLSVGYLNTLRKAMPDVKFSGGSDILSGLRSVKDQDEKQNIIKAQSITDAAFAHILRVLSENVGRKDFTETDVALELEFFMRKNGSEGVAFDTISVSGTKSSLPHGVPENIPVSQGFLTMDFGARFDGYCADMTRTVCIGKVSQKMRHVYDTVLAAGNEALENIYGGIIGNVADAFARNVIDNAGYKGRFGHSLGHSLGLDIHENPNFSPAQKEIVPAGAVVSVEPGIYLPGEFGVRIEDIVYLTDDGCENLTHSTKELIVI